MLTKILNKKHFHALLGRAYFNIIFMDVTVYWVCKLLTFKDLGISPFGILAKEIILTIECLSSLDYFHEIINLKHCYI